MAVLIPVGAKAMLQKLIRFSHGPLKTEVRVIVNPGYTVTDGELQPLITLGVIVVQRPGQTIQ
jgi:hypothetical protein